ncbi:DEAD/DEAH box helicase [Alteribacter lacisalsi]|uniref:ATP-dependent RNA helicase CshA n=1 Tax=Alteribacter lacisalsi TaxID=2045244 RepID=A0A2W0HGZ5_9BACI|nr:DEAD/DEAH box helicase [Alteribacter lacisalsi]PYZ96182.1 DEAD/DEAH box helicase [Alteribacter lacisalsi]
MTVFADLDIHPLLLKSLDQMGFEEPTPIQKDVLPIAKTGKDVIGQAQTGTGKTAAFGIPLIEKMEQETRLPQGIVLAPTRELAIQVAEELNKIGRYSSVRALPIYGGQEIGRQIRALKNRPQIIVATPGRLQDHMRRGTIKLSDINTVVLDEADEMLSMGFVEEIEEILESVPDNRQTLLFSATMPPRLQSILNKYMNDPAQVKVKAKEMTVANIDQRYVEVHERQKFDTLCRLIDIHSPELAIVFGRTKRRVDELADALFQRGYEVEGIHGDLPQNKRDKVIQKFKSKRIEILVATDVAARGLDVSGVSHVFNFDLPQDPESYVHRIGRTGRAGKHGVAFSFVTPREKEHINVIEKTTKKKMTFEKAPTLKDASEGRQQQAAEQLTEVIENEEFASLTEKAEELLGSYDAVTLVSAALKLASKEPGKEVSINLTSEPPVRIKHGKGPKGGGGYKGKGGYRGGGKPRSNDRRGRPGSSDNRRSRPEGKKKDFAFAAKRRKG